MPSQSPDRVLALDQSHACTGWAFDPGTGRGAAQWGEITIPSKTSVKKIQTHIPDLPYPTLLWMKRVYMQQEIRKLYETLKPDKVLFEGVVVGRDPAMALKLGELRGLLIGDALSLGYQVDDVPTVKAKQYLGIGGRARRQPTIDAAMWYAKMQLGEDVPEDASMAIALLNSYVSEAGQLFLVGAD